jgi:hypothetical protein
MKAGIPLFALSLLLWHPHTASATLTTDYSVSGNVGLSVDGGGSTQSTLPNGLTTEVPTGSTVIAAYLYTSTFELNLGTAGSLVANSTAGGTLNGNNITYTALPANASSHVALQAGVANVTSIVQAEVNPSGVTAVGGVYNFTATETNTAYQDGEVLITVYSNPSLPTASIGILDGAASSAGDISSINFASNPAGDTVLMSVGDGFSYDLSGETNQFSTIDVDGSLLTAAAGNCDESQDGGTPPNATGCNNGDLITAGVLGLNSNGSVDSPYSNPFTTIGDTNTATDHELYNISSLINPADGDTIGLTTANSSLDDNIFEETFYVAGLAGFNAPPPPPTNAGPAPEPSSITLLGTAVGLGMMFWKQRKPQLA